MHRSVVAAAVAVFSAVLSVAAAAGAAMQDPPPTPPVRVVHIVGAREISAQVIEDALRITLGDPLPDTPERLAESVRRQYRDEGYTFARVKPSFDAGTGELSLDVDEGTIDSVVFQGVDEKLARSFADEFALRAGDVFNSTRARQALEVLLRPTRGSVRAAGRTYPDQFDSRDVTSRRGTFDLIDRNGERILVVGLKEPSGRFKIVPDLGEREDWFSTVDGFVPSLGMGIAVFDHDRFNHTFIAGHLSYKVGSEKVGYALGFERPLFGTTKVYVGGELHDLTATDDQWQLSSLEASLAAVGPGRSFRDYYRREGVQITGAVRLHPQIEVLAAWRGEHQSPLYRTTDFSFWDPEGATRPNLAATDGRLNAMLIGASFDGRGFDHESLEATYRRHQFDTLYGERLDRAEGKHDLAPIWRVDWMSEFSEPGAFGSDFDFRRHIVSGRARLRPSEHQRFGVRAMGGWSDGLLPPQRLFSVGGVGSVHGYDFKTETGDTLALLNLEYEVGWMGGLRAIGFFDTGRATLQPPPGTPAAAAAPWLKGVGWGIAISDFRIDFGYRVDAVPSSLSVVLRLGHTF